MIVGGAPVYTNASAKLTVLGTVTADGKKFFDNAEDDVEKVAQLAATWVEKLADKILELSGMGGRAADAEKNSAAGTTSASA